MIKKTENLELDRNLLSVGDKVWGFSYSYSRDKESLKLKQVPVLGMITAGNTESYNNRLIEVLKQNNHFGNPGTGAMYFTPFKKNGNDLAWSKSVRIYNRIYTENEEDAIKMYNDEIRKCIKWHQDEILRLQEEMVIK